MRGTMVPDVEDPLVLADINEHFGGNYLREASLARLCPVVRLQHRGHSERPDPPASQDLSEVDRGRAGVMREPVTIILEGATGTPRAVPLSAAHARAAEGGRPAAGAAAATPVRPGRTRTPGTRAANIEHQQWFADAATKAILPAFAKSAEPFVLVYWSGDPDYTQHAQGDSLNS